MTTEQNETTEQQPEIYAIEPQYLIDKLKATGLDEQGALHVLMQMAAGDEEAKQKLMAAADLVQTKRGMVPREKLVVTRSEDEGPNAFESAIEFYLDGELVRRDAWVNMKRGLSMGAAQAQMA